MVAKTVRLMAVSAVLILAGCQTIPLNEPVAAQDARRQANEPEQIEVPDAPEDGGQASDAIPVVESQADVMSSETTADTSDQPDTVTASEPEEPAPSPERVVTRLQQQALQLQAEGRWAEAELILERALRIDAEKVDIYHQLATVRLGQQRFSEAEQIALKGLSLTDETPKYKASLWEVIAQCRSAMGNVSGATEARTEMRRWMAAE
ncbi:tetratricopeptide repeat protein [Reinekea blandensis]|uniref:Uncharacterized protein n=1 Tax=Reinekea blandensis MED297 TaxID=314283 RepID=A4BE83_9GAMM|nr:tetratricopeptide repeat protein [Reinekea blandensis]EAR09561.1 hypothetical protein MED297_12557 [Reinekea blandensis MED297]